MDGKEISIIETSITFEHFQQLDIRVGTILTAELNPKARQPAFILTIDFGPLGIKTSSAQLTENYRAEDLIDRQIMAVLNFAPKRIAGIKSELLVLGALSSEKGTLLLATEQKVANGSRVG